MSEINEMPEVSGGMNPEPKKNNIWIWVVAVVVLLCCCCVGTFVFYQYLGDPIAQALGF